MDENALEMAEEFTLKQVERGIRNVQSRLPKQPENFDGLCVDCEDEIPPQRIKFGAITCINCQQIREKKIYLRINEP